MNNPSLVQLNVAQIGCGLTGRKRSAALGADFRLLYACDSDPVRAAGLAQPTSGCLPLANPDAAFAGPRVDAVIVSTPNVSLAPLAHAAIRAGKHVLLEK